MSVNDSSNELSLDEEPVFPVSGAQLVAGSMAPDFAFKAAVGDVNLTLSSVLQNGPVLLNFIKGTWCPFCQTYMSRLNKWRSQLKGKSVSSLVISNESPAIIRSWLKVHPVDFLFGSVQDPAVFVDWGVRINDQAFARPATFLIDGTGEIRLVFNLSRGSRWETSIGNIGIP